MGDDLRVEVVRGRLDEDGWPDRLVRFWTSNGLLDEAQARERVAQVVCAVTGLAGGEVVGACSVYAADVALVGGRRFWMFRSALLPQAGAAGDALLATAFATLDAEFDPASGGPIGLCVLLDGDQARRRPEAVWTSPPLLYAGYLDDRTQVRIGYFTGASIAPGGQGNT